MDVKYKTKENALVAINEDSSNVRFVCKSLQIHEPEILSRVIEKRPQDICFMHYHVHEKNKQMHFNVMIKAVSKIMVEAGLHDPSNAIVHFHVSRLVRELSEPYQRAIKLNAKLIFFNSTPLRLRLQSNDDLIKSAANMLDQIFALKDSQLTLTSSILKVIYESLYCCQDNLDNKVTIEISKHVVSYLSMFDFASMAYVSNKEAFIESRSLLPKGLANLALFNRDFRTMTVFNQGEHLVLGVDNNLV